MDFDLVPASLVEGPPGRRALLYARIFWPTFVEMHGMVLLESTVESDEDAMRLKEALERHRGDRSSVEEEFNFHELDVLFGGLSGVSPDEEEWLIEKLAAMWRARLKAQFPDRAFVVGVVRPSASEGHELGLVFYQRRTA